jgi:hypothetical protein
MAKTQSLPVEGLSLDLRNFRTVPQSSEKNAIHGMIAVNPDWLWALMESLMADDGYLPTENILILKHGDKLVVKEGNRRIAALKLIHGYIKRGPFPIPDYIETTIKNLSQTWITNNKEVPCTIYEVSESAKVDRIVTLTHGKGEKAGRDKWEAVARARHNRDIGGASEPALDLLERYIKEGKNITSSQQDRWGGVYPLTVLEEALKKIAPRYKWTARELSDAYPKKLKHRTELESVLLDIGLGKISFDTMRHQGSLDNYGFPAAPVTTAAGAGSAGATTGSTGAGAGTSQNSTATGSQSSKPAAVALNSPVSVMRTLARFKPVGLNRDKLVTLRDEAKRLKLDKNPLAFCFLLRSMFEISAKAYCADHASNNGPKVTGADGKDRPLVDVLQDVTAHLKKSSTDKGMQKVLHGASTQITKPSGLLSVTSMNQLVHNPKFTTDQSHINAVFHNIFPLLEAMNR